MKKPMSIICLCLVVILLTACAASSADNAAPVITEEPIHIDLDLTKLSATAAYAQLDNITYNPDPYMGMTIKMAGTYSVLHDTLRDEYYHACVVSDVTACCAMGLEFVWAGEHVWPDDYPSEGDKITVTGTLGSYEQDGFTYLHLVDAKVAW